MTTNYIKLSNNLESLKLFTIKENLPNYIDMINSGEKSTVDALYELTEKEMDLKEKRAIKACVHTAGFPFEKTINDFDFSFQPSINKNEIEDYTSLRFMENNENILFIGSSGTGKTHLATSIGIEAAKHRKSVYFITCQELMLQLKRAESENRLDQRLKFFTRQKLLIIDEIGYINLDKEDANLFFQLISRRYEQAIYMSTLIVSLQSTKVYIQDFYKKIENKKRKRISIDDSILSKIEYNTINVLVGKNGSGKSMSLEYINTQLPDSVMLPENYHLMDVSKKENICLNQDIDYDNSFLEDIPNEHVGNDNLSGGQQFRMVLMRTLLTDAKIILIDNNFMSVDSKLREKIFEYLKKSGKTIVFTDHLYRNEYKELMLAYK